MFDVTLNIDGQEVSVSVEMGSVTGPRGERGPVGKGFQIKATYPSAEALQAVTDAENGDFFNVGTEPPYTIYLFDGKEFLSQGQLQGPTGADGFSPTVTGVKQDGVLTLTVTDRSGSKEYTVADGAAGQNGTNGQDGFSPVVETSKQDGVTTVTITSASGVATAQIHDGVNGQDGAAGPNVVDASTETTLNGILKGTGAGVSTAAAGVDFPKFGRGWVVTLSEANWTAENTQSIPLEGMPADTAANCVFVSPASITDRDAWLEADIWTAQAEGAVSFLCANVPTVDIQVCVWLMEGVAG